MKSVREPIIDRKQRRQNNFGVKDGNKKKKKIPEKPKG